MGQHKLAHLQGSLIIRGGLRHANDLLLLLVPDSQVWRLLMEPLTGQIRPATLPQKDAAETSRKGVNASGERIRCSSALCPTHSPIHTVFQPLPCPVTFPIIYLGMKQGEMVRALGATRTDSLTSVIKPRDFYSPEPLPPPIAAYPNSREEAVHSNAETNLSCPFQDVALKIHFLVCSATMASAWVVGGRRAGPVSAHHSWLSQLVVPSTARRSCSSTDGRAALAPWQGDTARLRGLPWAAARGPSKAPCSTKPMLIGDWRPQRSRN